MKTLVEMMDLIPSLSREIENVYETYEGTIIECKEYVDGDEYYFLRVELNDDDELSVFLEVHSVETDDNILSYNINHLVNKDKMRKIFDKIEK